MKNEHVKNENCKDKTPSEDKPAAKGSKCRIVEFWKRNELC